MQDIAVGTQVFYIDYANQRIGSRIINGRDKVDGHFRYWLQGYFGYFDRSTLCGTHQEAKDKLQQWRIINDRFDETT